MLHLMSLAVASIILLASSALSDFLSEFIAYDKLSHILKTHDILSHTKLGEKNIFLVTFL